MFACVNGVVFVHVAIAARGVCHQVLSSFHSQSVRRPFAAHQTSLLRCLKVHWMQSDQGPRNHAKDTAVIAIVNGDARGPNIKDQRDDQLVPKKQRGRGNKAIHDTLRTIGATCYEWTPLRHRRANRSGLVFCID